MKLVLTFLKKMYSCFQQKWTFSKKHEFLTDITLKLYPLYRGKRTKSKTNETTIRTADESINDWPAKHEFLWRVYLILGQAPHTVSPNERMKFLRKNAQEYSAKNRNQGCFGLKVILESHNYSEQNDYLLLFQSVRKCFVFIYIFISVNQTFSGEI